MKNPIDKQILFINSNPFSRGWGGVLPRLLDIANGCVSYGWDVSLLMSNSSSSLEKEFPGAVIHSKYGNLPEYLNKKGFKYLFGKLHKYINPILRIPDRRSYWGHRFIKEDQHEIAGKIPGVLWAISTGEIDALIIGMALKQKYNAPLFVDLQDPIPHPLSSHFSKKDSRIFSEILLKCDKIITTTRTYADQLNKIYPGKAEVIYLSYASRIDKYVGPAEKHFTLLHTGYLHGRKGRNALDLLCGLKMLFDLNPNMKNKIKVKLLGMGKGIQEAEKYAEKMNIRDSLETVPQVPREACLDEMSKADVLVVIKFADPAFKMQIPGKLFEYFGMRKTILGILPEDSEAAELIRQSGLGFVINNNDHQRIAEVLLDIYMNNTLRIGRIIPNEDFLAKYSQDAMAKKINGLFEEALNSVM